MDFDFASDGIWKEMSAVRVTHFVEHIPLTIYIFNIRNANYGSEFVDAVIERVAQFHNLKTLWIIIQTLSGQIMRKIWGTS